MGAMSVQRRVIVVGAGLAGLMAARVAADHGCTVTVFDKGRGIGGRMATRRTEVPGRGTARFDHGAQFFTVRDPRFDELVSKWVADGVVREWCRGFDHEDGHPRYVAVDGMAALAKHIARGIDVRSASLVFSVALNDESSWTVTLDDGTTHVADGVIVTCPLPQSYSLLVTSGVELPRELVMTDYDRTLALLAVLDQPTRALGVGGRQNPDDVFSWIGDNQAKGISDLPAVTFHANPEWSNSHWDTPHDEAHRLLRELASAHLPDASIVQSEFKRWRFATPRSIWPEPCFVAGPGETCAAPAPLALAGDAFAGPKVEGAVLSGLAAGDWMRGRV
jgi:predicted NAD/FAD-dependent oxidoreductase